jgi:hypothetical protein
MGRFGNRLGNLTQGIRLSYTKIILNDEMPDEDPAIVFDLPGNEGTRMF